MSRVCGIFCRFCVVYTVFPSVSPVFTAWHASCFVYEPDKRYTEIAVKTTQQTNSSRNKTKKENTTVKFNIFNKAILIATSVAAITTCVASAGPSKTQSTAKKITLVGTGNPNDPDPDQLYLPPGSVTATDPNPDFVTTSTGKHVAVHHHHKHHVMTVGEWADAKVGKKTVPGKPQYLGKLSQ